MTPQIHAISVALLAMFTAMGAAVVLMPLLNMLAFRFGIVAQPSPDRPHSIPTPLLGGVAIMAGFALAIRLFGSSMSVPHLRMTWMLTFAALLFTVGFVDDIAELRPRVKLGWQIVIIVMFAAWGPQLDLLPYHWTNVALTIFWLVTTTNAFNLIDGLDGLAAGVGIFAALAIAAIAGLHGRELTMIAAASLAGALGGFLLFNLPPASTFMGDEGALSVGLILGILSIQASHAGEGSWPARFAVPILIVMVPILDVVTVTMTRLATGNPISRRGLDHSHHRLNRLGLTGARAAASLVALQAIAAGCAIFLTLIPGYEVVLMLPYVAIVFALVALFLMDRSFDTESPGLTADLPVFARFLLTAGYKRRVVEVMLDLMLACAAFSGAMLLRFEFEVPPQVVAAMLATMPAVMLATCSAFILTGVYKGIWRYSGVDEAVRFAASAVIAGLGMRGLSFSLLTSFAIPPASCLVFVVLLFNLLLATRWSFHVFNRVVRMLAASGHRVVIVGADARGQAAVMHLFNARTSGAGNSGSGLMGVIDDDTFKRGKLFHGYPVLGSISELEEIFARTAFDEILIAQKDLHGAQLDSLKSFADARGLDLRRFSLDVTDISAPSGRDLRAAVAFGAAALARKVPASIVS
jgi:UDP-GlcNAc:undecaprenyl-phosphate/decaprenyl-phosphate GlcNAc-1-phosphate transferase